MHTMENDMPRTDLFNELSCKARNGDKEARKLLDKIYNGESFKVGKKSYKIVSR